MINPIARLRFKTGTSFAIALLGCITFARLLSLEPLTGATMMPLSIAAIFVVAGVWRGLIYWNAIRGLAKS